MGDQQLTALARTISTETEKLSKFYDGEALELRFPSGKPTDEQGRAIGSALKAALQLQRMLLGPVGSIMSLGVTSPQSELPSMIILTSPGQ